jgi:hypothetical protein
MLTRILACSLLALAAAGCGDDDGPSVCTGFTFTACGGDVVGTWQSQGLCPTGTESSTDTISDDPACASSSVTSRQSVSSVSYTFNADNTYTSTEISSSSGTIRVDSACVAVEAPGYTLQQACDQIDAEDGTTCSVSGDVCTCRYSETSTNTDTGTYLVTGNTITIGWQPVEFCVDGNQLQLARGGLVDGQTHIILGKR